MKALYLYVVISLTSALKSDSYPKSRRFASTSTTKIYNLPGDPSNLRTQYTFHDLECPPTRPHILSGTVQKACASLDMYLSRKPIAAHTKQAFEMLLTKFPEISDRNITLDSGCGTARSTILLGEKYPDNIVIGVDRSFTRITKKAQGEQYEQAIPEDDESASSKRPFCQKLSDNVIIVRAELVDFWHCCLIHNLAIQHHYILYPNPYPTQTRVTQRWYAHPSFPMVLRFQSKSIVVRSNWQQYLIEFARAVEIANDCWEEKDNVGHSSIGNYASPYLESARLGPSLRSDKSVAWTNFEKKYDIVGENTYELILQTLGLD